MRDVLMSIDPGLKGGIVVWDRGDPKVLTPMPVVGKEIDIKEIVFLLDEHSVQEVVIEKVGGLPGQSASAGWTFGCGWGMIIGACIALDVRVHSLSSSIWQAKFHAGLPKTIEPKERSRMAAQRLYPGIVNEMKTARARLIHDGIADALGIGHAWIGGGR